MMLLLVLFTASVWAGLQNALAGGGSFITFPALLISGLDARSANITSTIALFPAQILTGWIGRRDASGVGALPFRALFERLVPWLVLFATAVFAWGSFRRRTPDSGMQDALRERPVPAALAQGLISVYGGYFGGGIGILMLAALTMAGMAVRRAAATKNVLAGVMNTSAVAIFLIDAPHVAWAQAAVVGSGAMLGGAIGGRLVRRVPEKLLRAAVVVIGLVLTAALFARRLP
jgi:uncharacterized protein